jgi:FkbM family methyltransferase
MNLIEDKKTGILYRDQTFDKWIVNESKCYVTAGLVDTDVVADIGGHIGATASRFRLENKNCQIISFEPEKSNFEVLQQNAAKFNFEAINAAIVSDDLNEKNISLFVNTKKNNALHSVVSVRGRPTQDVYGLGFSAMLSDINPTVLKIDIESGEFFLPFQNIHGTRVRMIIMELHLLGKDHLRLSQELTSKIQDVLGFKPVLAPKVDGKRWTTLGKWIKE